MSATETQQLLRIFQNVTGFPLKTMNSNKKHIETVYHTPKRQNLINLPIHSTMIDCYQFLVVLFPNHHHPEASRITAFLELILKAISADCAKTISAETY